MSDTTITDVLNAVRFEYEGDPEPHPLAPSVSRIKRVYEASAFIRQKYEDFWGSVKGRATSYALHVGLIELATVCVRAILDLDLMSGFDPCPLWKGVVNTGWCEARGRKTNMAPAFPRCPDQWRPEVRAECCRAYFEEQETKEGAA